MKQALLFWLLAAVTFGSCSKSDSTTLGKTALPGMWTLTETLVDPGDGSGTWKPAPAPLTLTFTTDGRIDGNAFPQARTYNLTNDSSIRFTFSDGTFINYNYVFSSSTLVLSGGGCIEACGLKFIKNRVK